jgi:superfamily II DNA/RNA helicase
MSSSIRNQAGMLQKLGIEQLNPMQEQAIEVISSQNEVVLLSPTGTGKTLAFLLPVINALDPDIEEVQTIILAPSRELAIQIEQVARDMGSGFKTNAVYGGRLFSKDKQDLKHRPAILIGTPGRVADHLRRDTFSTQFIQTLVLDEFDKSLEVGFESEMSEIISLLSRVQKRVLTSATQEIQIPGFVRLRKPNIINFLDTANHQLEIKKIISSEKDKLQTLLQSIRFLGNQPGIIFCNFKGSISRLSEFLDENNIPHGCFYGGLEQKERERALIKFRNGTYQLLIATDLAARGIDVPEIKYIIHYHLPIKNQEFTHRNGRTARMNSDGTAYVLAWKNEKLPDFIENLNLESEDISESHYDADAKNWTTLFISGGRKDKISKGDIAGAFFKQGKLKPNQLGTIELKSDCAFVAVSQNKAKQIIQKLNNTKLKKKKIRITEI